ncbi:sulfoxide reductase heme-binding subunit YedZ [Magnetovirga frankeli]|uniref:sulfite oxidase heme-binding subunit YedZ n=1 Tax=Magnetovirga frankeli TaxID=947516 RepID=UPI00129374FE|nr:sulfoxide reductase heme-binding subunit YedZ [gamma proteobacterium SS-5]
MSIAPSSAPGTRVSDPRLQLIKIGLFLASLSPLYEIAWYALSGRFGDYPSWEIIGMTGEASLIFLLLTLSVTPLRKWTGWNGLIKIRRMLGLFAFFYATLHFLVYIWREDNFIVHEFFLDVAKLPYITVGFLAWLMLIPVAATANDPMMKKAGKNWKRIHSMVYPITFFSVLHYLLVRTWNPTDVLWYAAILVGLLAYRFYHARSIKEWVF